jgi:hypothetical protein
MTQLINKLWLAIFLSAFISVSGLYAQKKWPDCIKVAKINRPNWIVTNSSKVTRFYKNYGEDVAFDRLKLVKSELAYYLIATELNGQRIFAFELEQKRKRLFLNKKFLVQTCSEGELSLDTFLQENGKITGCRIGNHSTRLQ